MAISPEHAIKARNDAVALAQEIASKYFHGADALLVMYTLAILTEVVLQQGDKLGAGRKDAEGLLKKVYDDVNKNLHFLLDKTQPQ